MKKIAISLVLAASLALAACSNKEAPTESPEAEGDITAVVAEADRWQKTATLEAELKAAKSNVAALGKVWEKANAAGITSVAEAADKQLATILLPEAKAAKTSSAALIVTKKAPMGSPIRKDLQKIDNDLLLGELADGKVSKK